MVTPCFPVLRVRLVGFDVVYVARIAQGGYVPATLCPSSGTIVDVALSPLTNAELAVMDETEGVHLRQGGYVREKRRWTLSYSDSLPSWVPPVPTEVEVYLERNGLIFSNGGKPIALAAISATGRVFPAKTEAEVLDWVAQQCRCTVQQLIAMPGPQRRALVNPILAGGATKLPPGAVI